MKLLSAGTLLLLACVILCSPARATGAAKAPVFYRDVLPILQQHCQSCHRRGEIAPMPLVTYDDARPLARLIANDTGSRKMPPWFADPRVGHFSNDPSLSQEEIATLAAWAAAGAPSGNPADAPAPRHWAFGWNIPTPDLVIRMPKPVPIPPLCEIEYTYEIVPTGFTVGKWVQMSEIRPSSRANVHHAVVYIRPPDSPWLRHAPIGVPFTASDMKTDADRRDTETTKADILLVYAPGSSPDNWPNGMAKYIPAGSDLIFQMHYTSGGRPTVDQTSLGIVFAKRPPAKRVLTLQLTNSSFVIPPGVDDYRVEVHGSLPNDALLLSFFPHMHLRGKRFEYNILRPDGSTEPLLRVDYDFYWQLSYRLPQPMPLKAGTVLQAVAWYDNSKKNPHNPDPASAVYWGDQTADEMMVGFFDVAVDANIGKPQFFIRHSQAQ
ncbi:MAG TPA: cytochrome c [Candidatus Aquilonibacter sp.]|nr:cytochrome c [Candidatus Aquilonibacter sp.]